MMFNIRRFVHKGSLHANLFPVKIFNKRHKVPAHFYVAEDQLVEQIDNAIQPFMQQTKCDTAIEMNPGIGLFTRKLLNKYDRLNKIILIEPMEHFLPALHEFHTLYPERVKVKHNDIVSLWKLSFQDRMDNGTRVSDMLSDLPKREYNEGSLKKFSYLNKKENVYFETF